MKKTVLSIKLFLLSSIFILQLYQLSCNSTHSSDSQLTYTISRGCYDITVVKEGEIEAKNSHVFAMPMIQAQPKIAAMVPEGAFIKKGDIVVQLEASEIAVEHRNAIDEVAISKAESKRNEADLATQRLLLESQIKSTEASATIARLQLSKLKFEPPRVQEIHRLEIARSEIDANKMKKKLKSLEKIQKEERTHMQMKIKQAENKLTRCAQQLDQLTLRAPFDGIIVYERNWMTGEKVKEGDMLFPGMPVVKIPDLSMMQVKCQIGETEAQKIKKDQPATISIPSIGDYRLKGKVSRVDNVAKPIKRGSKVKKVEVIVDIDSTRTGIVPGLTATVSIITQAFQNVFTVPHECVFEKDSIKVVYLQRRGSFIPHEVITSEKSDNFVIIEGDLQDGDRLALKEEVNWQKKKAIPFDGGRKSIEADSSVAKFNSDSVSLNIQFNK